MIIDEHEEERISLKLTNEFDFFRRLDGIKMYEYDVIIGYYECPFNEEYQIELTIMANNSDEISSVIDGSYHGMIIVSIDGYAIL